MYAIKMIKILPLCRNGRKIFALVTSNVLEIYFHNQLLLLFCFVYIWLGAFKHSYVRNVDAKY